MIFLSMLKLLLSFILILLFILLVFIVLVLFAPFVYELNVVQKKQFSFSFKISWLFSILSYNYFQADSKSTSYVKIFWFKLFKSIENDREPTASQPSSSDTFPQKKIAKSEAKRVKTEARRERSENRRTDRKSFFEQASDGYNKILKIWYYKDRTKIFNAFCLGLKRILRAFRACHTKIFGEFGLESPALTGYLFGAISPFLQLLPLEFDVLPNFSEQVIDLTCAIKGKFQAFPIFFAAVSFILNKQVWGLLTKIRKGEQL